MAQKWAHDAGSEAGPGRLCGAEGCARLAMGREAGGWVPESSLADGCVRVWGLRVDGGWMDGWMGGWVDGWMDGWLAGSLDGWMDGWMDGFDVDRAV